MFKGIVYKVISPFGVLSRHFESNQFNQKLGKDYLENAPTSLMEDLPNRSFEYRNGGSLDLVLDQNYRITEVWTVGITPHLLWKRNN
ncbi:MAG TPA: hypothetical protein PKY08_00220 [Candidatus Magasanikbacteria bacterium]|nr:hypothetical protein [Candidatus Magasanikbacteria bacterium]